ncbi:Forkhead-associated protein [[Leptolyngbya] sp. PCC 7376]|uniref:FHA domain-containing protein n=1 Tax=[Leptolyngbya] sp. PCC 7376 TaxID=111781 RepID=UPI00029F29B3|nr:FHA domain-containing protein [[Leptolyngbya] sp. PCC 7376]AFY37540.1 Forkhead-associated protein [[Leptolyngbya] sp. PCC 7376]
MITLTLLHPLQSVPVQNWTFGTESVVRVGRSTDNDVVLYSAVVSRHHVELRQDGQQWKVVNLGTNGTYIDGKRVDECEAQDGLVIRLASSGPKIQIRLKSNTSVDDSAKSSKSKRSSTMNPNARSKDTLVN